MQQPTFKHDGNETICSIKDPKTELEFIGSAYCHPNDEDMMNDMTGESIASARAACMYLRYIIDHELMPAYKVLKHLLSCFESSDKYNRQTAESKLVYRQFKQYEDDIKYYRDLIKETKSGIKNYIDAKDDFYQKVRKGRAGQDIETTND